MKKHMKKMQTMLSLILILPLALSCKGGWKHAGYRLPSSGEVNLPITDWDVYGPVSENDGSVLFSPVVACEEGKVVVSPSDTIPMFHDGFHKSKYGQLDLHEVYGISPEDTTCALRGKVTYLCCHLFSDRERDAFVDVNSTMDYSLYMNGDTLRRLDIQGPNLYSIHLRRGANAYLVQARATGNEYIFESRVCDSVSALKVYASCQSGNIMYPFIDKARRLAVITNAHQRVVQSPVKLSLKDVYGKEKTRFVLKKDSFEYAMPQLKDETSYMCVMSIGDVEVRQPVLYGDPDSALVRFSALRRDIGDAHPQSVQIDGLLYRLRFLLEHPSRYDGDWWWQFKIPTVTYQLECAFARVRGQKPAPAVENNVQVVSYKSGIDGSVQHYMLARPNSVTATDSLPLVVIVRPFIENPHPFLSCPQLARQWAINQMQWFANKYHCLIVMPEMRMGMRDDVTPKAEAELADVVERLSRLYPVDMKRLYLHANCSGGYRALRIAVDNPDKFAAVALYAPVYHCPYGDEASKERAPEKSIAKLKRVPILVVGDPVDGHSPVSMYKDLVTDARGNCLDLKLLLKRNSGRYYNVCLVGEDAFDFFMRAR